jgi:hypothetical protein
MAEHHHRCAPTRQERFTYLRSTISLWTGTSCCCTHGNDGSRLKPTTSCNMIASTGNSMKDIGCGFISYICRLPH